MINFTANFIKLIYILTLMVMYNIALPSPRPLAVEEYRKELYKGCPKFEIVLNDINLCSAPRCNSDEQCKSGGENNDEIALCCYNGCVKTCVEKLKEPLYFDHIEDLDEGILPEEEPKGNALTSEVAERESETVYGMIGGCVLNKQQMEEIKEFESKDTIEKCECKNGEIYCLYKTDDGNLFKKMDKKLN